MSVNWAMGYQQGPNIGQQFQQAYEAGTQRRRQEELRSALQGVATRPDDPNAVHALIQADPIQGMQYRQQQAQTQQAATERQREQIRLGARIVRQINPRDEATWQQALQIARQAGVDLSQVPQNFDPNYVQQLIQAGQALEPQGQQGRPIVIDGVAMDPATGQALFESPYDRIIPGQGGGFYRVPRLGIGRGGQPQPQPGTVVQGQGGQLPPGWTPIEDDEGGPQGSSPAGSF